MAIFRTKMWYWRFDLTTALTEWKKLDPIDPLFCIRRFGDQFQIVDALTDAYFELMSVDDASKDGTVLLPVGCNVE